MFGLLIPIPPPEEKKAIIMPLCEHTMKAVKHAMLRGAVSYVYSEAIECATDVWWRQILHPIEAMRMRRRRKDIAAMRELLTVLAELTRTKIDEEQDYE